jgi:hypothetical protein
MLFIITSKNDIFIDNLESKLKYDYTRINLDDFFNFNNEFYRKFKINSNDKNIVFFRKLYLPTKENYLKDLNIDFQSHCLKEFITSVIYELIAESSCINKILNPFELSKIKILKDATKLGFVVPITTITNSKKELEKFCIKNKITTLICKPSNEVFSTINNNVLYKQYTTEFDLSEIKIEKFGYSFFQEKIESVYEVKVVYYLKELFAVAFFQTKDKNVDVRKNIGNIKTCLINLPNKIKQSITKLIKIYNLDICTLDFIVNTRGEYVFLELNPSGEFENILINLNIDIYERLNMHLKYIYEN